MEYSLTYLYGPVGQVLGRVRYNNLGKLTLGQYWIWLDGMPVAGLEFKYNTNGAVSSTNLYYLHSDHLNTPRMATNASQALLWTWNSDEFGINLPQEDVDGDGVKLDIPLRFPGQLLDAHSQMFYNYFRDYDQNRGRYMESDPIGLEGGLNTYGYVDGNPVRFFDLAGLEKMILFDPNDHVSNDAANKIPSQSGNLDIWGHGNSESIKDDSNGRENRTPLPPGALSDRIKDSGLWHPGMPITLWACDTGIGPNSFAAQLSRLLGVPVMAPNGRLIVMGGDYFVRKGRFSFSPKGGFVRFYNGSDTNEEVKECSCGSL